MSDIHDLSLLIAFITALNIGVAISILVRGANLNMREYDSLNDDID